MYSGHDRDYSFDHRNSAKGSSDQVLTYSHSYFEFRVNHNIYKRICIRVWIECVFRMCSCRNCRNGRPIDAADGNQASDISDALLSEEMLAMLYCMTIVS